MLLIELNAIFEATSLIFFQSGGIARLPHRQLPTATWPLKRDVDGPHERRPRLPRKKRGTTPRTTFGTRPCADDLFLIVLPAVAFCAFRAEGDGGAFSFEQNIVISKGPIALSSEVSIGCFRFFSDFGATSLGLFCATLWSS